MKSNFFTLLILAFTLILNNSCSSGDEVQQNTPNTSSQNPPISSSNKILKFIKSTNSNPTHYFQSSNGKLTSWTSSYDPNHNYGTQTITYNSMGKIDKIVTPSSNFIEIEFKYSNNLLSEILYVYKETNGNIYGYKSFNILYNNSQVHRIVKTDYNFAQSYIDDVLSSCKILELQFSNENVIKATSINAQFSRSTGVINENSFATLTRLCTYNNSIINPYSTFPIEFQIYLVVTGIDGNNPNYNVDILSKNPKNSIATYMYQSLFSNYYFNYETDASLNGLPSKIDSDNGNFGSKATFEYDSY